MDLSNEILKEFPSSEISFLGDFNVHNKNWLKFSSQNSPHKISMKVTGLHIKQVPAIMKVEIIII